MVQLILSATGSSITSSHAFELSERICHRVYCLHRLMSLAMLYSTVFCKLLC